MVKRPYQSHNTWRTLCSIGTALQPSWQHHSGQFRSQQTGWKMIGNCNSRDSCRMAGPSLATITAGMVWALYLPHLANAQGGFDGPGRYEIVNLDSGKVLDLDPNDRTSVIQ